MKILVVGAGIGGTSIALGLQRHGIEVEIVEQVRENKPVGAAISLWSNGIKCLNYLGVGEQVAALGGRMDHLSYADALTGETLCDFPLAPVHEGTGQRSYPVARADLQAMLMEAVGVENIRFGAKVVDITQDDDGVTATFADGSTTTADLLIAADGARSRTRAHVLGHDVERSYTGYTNVNGLVPADPAITGTTHWTTWVGENRRCAVMPVAGDRFYFWFDHVTPAGADVPREKVVDELRSVFGHWAPPVQKLIDAIEPGTANRVEIWDLDPIHTWVRGRVALLGDAAHSTAPDIGQGGCSALEDSVVLSGLLAAHRDDPLAALTRYQAARTERAAELVLKARKRSAVTHGHDPEATQAWYRELATEDGTGVMAGIVGNIVGGPFA
ncbi:FAD-dependent urate hydroxylase HpxO [Nocardioides bruguierae]|uniref:FAD-dependent urate hydroxylase n=1 Tax=Nocardioides bruguierae TaxID=2945102 RepID=A0A9X2IFH1_9ACTN|nr:FAD-dependent urate hydroxylase HpxO [Nocardioides bruguierae]MCL8026802.1 FAD-dependent urate hydroxylase HpxO [Nocardioides bruguierae]MCM0621068.1 FAD-dependent urate hydroxylase HpxO [Nocardioides bruguierae]